MKNLENYGVQELNSEDLKGNNGGGFPFVPVIALAVYLFDNRDRFIDGLKEGFE